MFCRNCGNEINENLNFCPKCGTKVEKNVPAAEADMAVPAVEETPVDVQPVAEPQESQTHETEPQVTEPQAEPAPQAEPVQTIPSYPEPQNQIYTEDAAGDIVKKAKKFRIPKFLIPIVVVLALAVTSFAHPVLRNSVMRTFMSDEAYFEHVMVNSAEDMAKQLADAISQFREMMDGETEASGSVEFELGDGAKDLVYEYSDYDVYEAVEWFDTAAIDFDAGKSGDVNGANMQVKINDTDIVSLNFAMEDTAMYISIPELSDEAICFDMEALASQGEMQNIMSAFGEIMEIIPEDKVLEDIIVRYITCIAKNIEDVEEEKITLEAGDVEQKAVAMTVTVDEDLAISVLDAVLEEILKDEDIEEIIKNVAELSMVDMDGDDMYDEFISAVEDLQDALSGDINLGNEEFDVTFVANNRGELIGASMELEGGEFEIYSVQDGKKYGQLIRVSAGQVGDIEIEGSGVLKGDKYTGDINFIAMGMDVVTVELEDVDRGLMEDGVFSGKCTVSAAENIGSLLSMTGNNEMASVLSDFKIELTSDSTKSKSDATLSLYMGDDLLGSIRVTADDSSNEDYEVPDDYVDATDSYELQNWISDLGDSVYGILGSLYDAGMPSVGMDY